MGRDIEMTSSLTGASDSGDGDAGGSSPVLAPSLASTIHVTDTGEKVSYFYHEKAPGVVVEENKLQLGTMSGVYIPTMNSIFGVVIFLRWGWAVGYAGIGHCIIILIIGCGVAVVTTLSVSAISTNEVVRAGGAYYMISRSLGPAFGASMGLLFYIAQALGVTFYTLGFAEVLQEKMGLQALPIVGSLNWNIFAIAIVTMVIVLALSLAGSSLFAKLGTGILAGIVFSLVFAILSAWVQPDSEELKGYGYVGMSVETGKTNMGPDYKGSIDFIQVFSVVYPSMTAILTGANMSGVLENPGKAIPAGTMASIVTMAISYGAVILTLGFSVERDRLQTDYFILQRVCYIHEFVLIGNLLATFSSALSGFVGVSRVLQAMCSDKMFGHRMTYFGHEQGCFEKMPVRAMLLTFVVSSAILFLGDVNAVAPILSNFLLITFAVLNFAAFVLDVSHTPNYRPTFKQCNWKVSLFGTLLCLGVMFMMDWKVALVSIIIAALVFLLMIKYPAPVKWGSPAQAVLYRVAMSYLMKLDARKQSVKYWRPQVLCILQDTNPDKAVGVAEFAADCKKRGVLVVGSVVVGPTAPLTIAKRDIVLNDLRNMIEANSIVGFPEAVVSPTLETGTVSLLQVAGLGALKPNTLVTPLPMCDLRDPANADSIMDWTQSIRATLTLGINCIVACGFEGHSKVRSMEANSIKMIRPTIDVWFTGFGDYYEMKELCLGRTMVVLQFAYLYSLNRFWLNKAQLRIVLMLPGHSLEDVKEHVESFRELMTLARLTAPIKVVTTSEAAEVMANLKIKRSAPYKRPDGASSLQPTPRAAELPVESADLPSEVDEEDAIVNDENVPIAPTELPDAPTIQDFDTLASTDRKRVLNQLLKRHSSDAAVVFVQESNTAMTYPSGIAGAQKFISDHKILQQGMCPIGCITPCDTLVDQRIGNHLGDQ